MDEAARLRPAGRADDRTIQALLEQEDWLRRLARGLLSDRSRADDLAQDVFVAALRSQPRTDGDGLRAWLATAARRMAGRRASRERARRRVEAEAHTLRDELRVVDERLELTESVVHALQGLSEERRAAVVLRYLEDVDYPEIARRLGVSESNARQRVSRGLGELRRRLDATHVGRAAWSTPLMVTLAPHATRDAASVGGGQVVSGTAHAAIGSAFIAFLAAKKIAAVVVVLLAAVPVMLLQLRGGGAPRSTPDDIAIPDVIEPELAQVEREDERRVPQGLASEASEVNSIHSPTNEAAPEQAVGRVLRVLGPEGTSPPDARAAWVNRAGAVQTVALDEFATGVVPTNAVGLVVASARGLSVASAPLRAAGDANADDEVVLRLRPLQTLRGRVVVDGGAPPRSICIGRRDEGPHSELPNAVDDRHMTLRLFRRLGVLPSDPTYAWTEPDGSFCFESVDPAATGSLWLPASLRCAERPEARSWPYAMPSEPLVLEATCLPRVHGRFVWDDSGEPIEGDYFYTLRRSGTGLGSSETAPLLPEGRFEIGLPGDPETNGAALDSGLSVRVFPREGTAIDGGFDLDLTALDLPHDVGEVRVRRSEMRSIRVLDRTEAPIPGAMLVSGWSTSRRGDAEGRIDFPLQAADGEVHAPGFVPRLIGNEMLAWTRTDEPMPVTLQRGHALMVSTSGHQQGDSERSVALCFVEMQPRELHSAAFESSSDLLKRKQRFERTLFAFAPRRKLSVRSSRDAQKPWQVRFVAGDRPVYVGPLRPQARVEVGVLDVFGNELARRSVELSEVAETRHEHFELTGDASGSLTVEVVDEAGAPVAGAGVSALIPRAGGAGNQDKEGRVTFEQLTVGEWNVDVRLGTHVLRRTISVARDTPNGGHVVSLEVPSTGTLEARLAQPLALTDHWAEVRVEIEEIGPDSRRYVADKTVTTAASGELWIREALLPGRYRIAADWVETVGDDESTYPRTPLYRGEIDVVAGEVTRIELVGH